MNPAFRTMVVVAIAVCLGVFWLSGAAHGEESALPLAFGAGRYEGLRQKSPFALGSATPPPQVARESFAANWYVSGIARVGEVDFVSIKARDLSTQFSLYGRERDSRTGVALVSVEWTGGIGKSAVTIEKDGERAKLEFNEAVVRGTAHPAAMILAGDGKASPILAMPVAGASSAPMMSGARPIPVGGVNGGAPQRYLRTVPPPVNLLTPAPNAANAAGPAENPRANGAPRPMLPGIRRASLPQNQPEH